MLPARRYRPRHAASRTLGGPALPAGLLLTAAGAAFLGLPPSAASTGPVAPQAVTLTVSGLAAGPAADPLAAEQVERRAAERQARADAARALAAARAEAAERDRARASRAQRSPEAVRPVARGPLTSPFGHRWGRLHAGLDFGVPVGTPVVAVADGVVTKVRYDPAGYGRYVVVRHADGMSSLYAHLSSVRVERGVVLAGDVLGRSGNTGHSTGPHLHFELRTAKGPFDARPWLRERGVKA